MSEFGRGLQIVNVTKSHSYELDEAELAQLLLRDDVKDLPVVVVSVAGAYRGGKSFLLNFFIRYLYSPVSEQQDGSWLGEDSKPLVGFKWRSGATATTMGVLMWSEPFITTLSSGEKVAVLLVDTQGNFDSKSTVRDNSTIFALSTLVSSIQIYNISQNIQEDHLQHLELFSEYGKLVNTNKAGGNQKAFQVLEFLVRDWQFPRDSPFGAVGGEQLLREKFEITEDLPKEMKNLRQHIMSSFETVSCFLMPHPGFDVLESTYRGDISEIRPVFRKQLIQLVNSIFSPAKLLPKKINGERVKARELFNYFKTYMDLFNSGEIPNPTSVYEATVKAVLLSAEGESRDVYEKGMSLEAGTKQPAVPTADLEFLHQKYLAEAVEFYNNKKKLGTPIQVAEYREKLTKELIQRQPQYFQSNLSKIHSAIERAKESYEKKIQDMCHDKPICVHPNDIEKIHQTALDAALTIYDSLVKRVTTRHDEDKAKFIQGFEKQLASLRLQNEQSNSLMVSILKVEYWQKMQNKTSIDPPLSEYDFRSEHNKAMAQALRDFGMRRTMPDSYTADVYKQQLVKKIESAFRDLQFINNHKLFEIERMKREEERQRIQEEMLRRQREEARRRQEAWKKQEAERKRREESKCYIL